MKQKQLYVYGMEFGRYGDQTAVRFTIDPNLIVDILSMDAETQDDFLEEYEPKEDAKSLSDRVHSMLCTMLYELTHKDKKKFFCGESFYMMTEEAGYGFGYTKTDAKLEYVDGEAKNGASSQGECDW